MSALLRIGTRKSPLALCQVSLVLAALRGVDSRFVAQESIEVVPIVTTGDMTTSASLRDIGGKGLFTKEIDEALLAGRIDLAVHSAKDMQTRLPEGCLFAAALPREDVRDVLISPRKLTLDRLPEGATIGTASLRRAHMLRWKRKDLRIQPIRGNVHTRIRKVEEGECDATILALAGLKRIGMDLIPGHILTLDEMLPAPAQGVIAIQCRSDDAGMQALLKRINHEASMHAAMIEREILYALDGSCKTPIAAYAEVTGNDLRVRAMLGNETSGELSFSEAAGTVSDTGSLVSKIISELRYSAGTRNVTDA